MIDGEVYGKTDNPRIYSTLIVLDPNSYYYILWGKGVRRGGFGGLTPRVVSWAGLFGSGFWVRAGFGPKFDKILGLILGLKRTFCLKCRKI